MLWPTVLERTTSEMTQGEQIMLRYQYVMDQTRLAAGDFVKTQDSWANQTRSFRSSGAIPFHYRAER